MVDRRTTTTRILAAAALALVSALPCAADPASPVKPCPTPVGAPPPLSELAWRLARATVVVCSRSADLTTVVGTGVTVSPGGTVLTAEHVVMDEDTGKPLPNLAIFMEGTSMPRSVDLAQRLSLAPGHRNIALLSIVPIQPDELFAYVPVAESVGRAEPVFVVGYPHGYDGVRLTPRYRSAIVSSEHVVGEAPALLLDMPSLSGWSGCPVVSQLSGGVVGLVRGRREVAPEPDFTVAYQVFPVDIGQGEHHDALVVGPHPRSGEAPGGAVVPQDDPPPEPAPEPAPRKKSRPPRR